MAGNILEWTRSLWGKTQRRPEFRYPYQPSDERENAQAGDDILRVCRGGSFKHLQHDVRCARRFKNTPYSRGFHVGFRVAMSAF
jgi:formylglycine-generating enzyme required for sulfatase activity